MVYLVRGFVVTLFFVLLASPAASGKPKAEKPAAKSGDLTGRYERGTKEIGSLLLMKKMDGDKYKFYLNSNWTSQTTDQDNTGLEFGVITVKDSKATYNSTPDPKAGFQLSFDFSKPDTCSMDCVRPENFGGKNVSPKGLYNRVSKKAPADSEFKE